MRPSRFGRLQIVCVCIIVAGVAAILYPAGGPEGTFSTGGPMGQTSQEGKLVKPNLGQDQAQSPTNYEPTYPVRPYGFALVAAGSVLLTGSILYAHRQPRTSRRPKESLL